MKIFSAEKIRFWDQYTILHEPISSGDLMERAATKCVEWLEDHDRTDKPFIIFCGNGNNGGDGLCIARLLSIRKIAVTVYIHGDKSKGSTDFSLNLERLQTISGVSIHLINSSKDLPLLNGDETIIDALFGTGLNRQPAKTSVEIIEHINESRCTVIAIDMPSGLFADRSSKGNAIITADHTLSFQCYKLAFLMPENEAFAGVITILDIGLHKEYEESEQTPYELIDEQLIHSIYKPRKDFAHKGNFGHALLIAGSYGKIGAAVLSARACLRSGVGLLTVHLPKCGYEIMQVTVPEAMVLSDFNSSFCTKAPDELSKYKALGIGPGLGTASETKTMLAEILDGFNAPMIIDADALNILATQKDWLRRIPAGSIITPHPKEFERLFGESENDFARIELALQKAGELNIIIVLKGHHTFIALPRGIGYFNSTGNSGMATGGSGDVLTGLLTGILAQGYESWQTAVLGVYLHGMAGDIAADKLSMEAMVAGDIADNLGGAFKGL